MAVYCSKTKWLVAAGGGSQDFCHFATTMSQVCARAQLNVQIAVQLVQILCRLHCILCNYCADCSSALSVVQQNTFSRPL